MSDMTDTTPGWLSADDLEQARARMPILYVEAVPVRVDDNGEVTSIGLLLRIGPDGTVNRTLVSGRVLHHERVRDALLRNLEKDLGPVALPRIPTSLQPFTVAEYFPTHGVTPYHDPRQHAVSLAYVVPVTGDFCGPGRTLSTSSGSARRRPPRRRCAAKCRAGTGCCSSRRWRTWVVCPDRGAQPVTPPSVRPARTRRCRTR